VPPVDFAGYVHGEHPLSIHPTNTKEKPIKTKREFEEKMEFKKKRE
jgi:hypothetical protein